MLSPAIVAAAVPPVYREDVEVEARASSLPEGVIAVTVSGVPAGAVLGPDDFTLNDGALEVIEARRVRLVPAIHVLVDTSCGGAEQLAPLLSLALRSVPDARVRLTFILPDGALAEGSFGDGRAETAWVAADSFVAWIDTHGLGEPSVAWSDSAEKTLPEALGGATSCFGELGTGHSKFVLLVTDGSTRHPWRDYQLFSNGSFRPIISPRPDLLARQAQAERALDAAPARLLFVACPMQGQETSRVGSGSWRFATTSSTVHLGRVAEATGGAAVMLSRGAEAAATELARVIARHAEPTWIAWRARRDGTPAFVKIECRRRGWSVSPRRVELGRDADPQVVIGD